MATGYFTLTELPRALVEIACDKCVWKGRYSKARLMAKHGRDIRLPDLLLEISKDCPKVDELGNDMCGARYEGL